MNHGGSNVCDLRIDQGELCIGTSKFKKDEKPDDENKWKFYAPYRSFYSYFESNKAPEISKFENFLKRSYSRT